jgi:hypothetical protein
VQMLTRMIHAQVSSSTGKQYGKEKMFDGCPDTCWHSKEGKPQSISLEFDHVRCRSPHCRHTRARRSLPQPSAGLSS